MYTNIPPSKMKQPYASPFSAVLHTLCFGSQYKPRVELISNPNCLGMKLSFFVMSKTHSFTLCRSKVLADKGQWLRITYAHGYTLLIHWNV